jgi:hypothetical protein
MPPPGEKPGETALTPDALKDLGIGEIADPSVRKEVEDFLKLRPGLIDDIKVGNKQAREVLAEKIKEINRTKEKANELIKSIVQTLLQKIDGLVYTLPAELQVF